MYFSFKISFFFGFVLFLLCWGMGSGYLFCFTGLMDVIFCLCERILHTASWNVHCVAGELLPQLPEAIKFSPADVYLHP